jgi:hypothetical protein
MTKRTGRCEEYTNILVSLKLFTNISYYLKPQKWSSLIVDGCFYYIMLTW